MKPCPTVSVLMTAFNRERVRRPRDRKCAGADLHRLRAHRRRRLFDGRHGRGCPAVSRRPARAAGAERSGTWATIRTATMPRRSPPVSIIKYHDSDDLMYPALPVRCWCRRCADEPSAGARDLGACDRGRADRRPMLLTPQTGLPARVFRRGPRVISVRRPRYSGARCSTRLAGFPECGLAFGHALLARACARVNVLLAYGDLYLVPRRMPGQELRRRESRVRRGSARVEMA